MKISVIIPAYNEARTIGACLQAVYQKNSGLDLEVIVVDDGSKDATAEAAKAALRPGSKYLSHEKNRGKGAAIRTGLSAATGDIVLIQDADLEYDPGEYRRLIEPFKTGAQVVYGSRILKTDNPMSYRRYYWGGRLVSWWTNLMFGSNITDEPTCYKVFKTDLLKSLDLECDGFEFCPEATAKILRRDIPIIEIPISYNPRGIKEGKKIRWHDGIIALWTLFKFRWLR